MKFNVFQTLIVVATLGLANAAPAADEDLVARRALTARAWEFGGKTGSRYDLSDHGSDCVKLVSSWEDRFSSIEVLSNAICTFYVGRNCLSLRRFTITDDFVDLTQTNKEFDDEISSYKCRIF